jgi:hypothetical protein
MTMMKKIARCRVAAARDLRAIVRGHAFIKDPLIFTIETAVALWAPIRLGGFPQVLVALPSKFAGLGFAAIALAILIPSAAITVACVNIVSRHIYREFLDSAATDARQAGAAKLALLVAKAGALAFFTLVPISHALQFLLLGSLWMVQALPAIGNIALCVRAAKLVASIVPEGSAISHRPQRSAIYHFT